MKERVGTSGKVRWVGVVVAGCAVLGGTVYALRSTNASPARGPVAAVPSASSAATAAPSRDASTPVASTDEEPRVTLGRKIFFDPSLSDPPGTSCASCHDPAHGYAGTNGSSVGTARGSRAGRFARRSTPSVLYLRFVRRFHMRWEEEADAPEAFGGFFWDGRSDSIATLVQQPLLNPNEMGNRDLAAIARSLRATAYADDLRGQFDGAFDSPENAVRALGECVEAFLTSPAMSPFSSRYDDYVRGQGDLTPIEARGLALFKDHAKGACSSCHTMNDRSPMPERSPFTDAGYDAVAPPRNRKLGPNADPRRYDLGLCERNGPKDAKWHTGDERFCGMFRTPSLRNVALRPTYMHNGFFSSLRDVVAFYATRATDPKRWYGGEGRFDDLPPEHWKNVNGNPAPYHRQEGETPVLDDADVDALVAFLGTLTDRSYPRP
jgi:cytochrome c peroxidase